MKKYPWQARSSSDPAPNGIGFDTEEEAIAHCTRMNALRDSYDASDSNDPKSRNFWNKDYWKTKPEPWVHSRNP